MSSAVLRNLDNIPGAVKLAARIARAHGTTLDGVLSRSVNDENRRARSELWSVLHGTLAMSHSQLGRVFGRDHTTVLKVIERRRRRELAL